MTKKRLIIIAVIIIAVLVVLQFMGAFNDTTAVEGVQNTEQSQSVTTEATDNTLSEDLNVVSEDNPQDETTDATETETEDNSQDQSSDVTPEESSQAN